MSAFLVGLLTLTSLALVLAFVREARLRHALQQLLARVFRFVKESQHARTEKDAPAGDPSGPDGRRLRGGPNDGARLNQVLRESLDRQAEMTKAILRQNREVAEAARKLVEADGQARKEFVALQQQVQAERLALLRQREAMESELRQLARQRHRDPVVAATLVQAAYLVAVAMCLALCWHLLRRLGADSDEVALRDLLLQELVSDRPTLLAPPLPTTPAIAQQQPPRALPPDPK